MVGGKSWSLMCWILNRAPVVIERASDALLCQRVAVTYTCRLDLTRENETESGLALRHSCAIFRARYCVLRKL